MQTTRRPHVQLACPVDPMVSLVPGHPPASSPLYLSWFNPSQSTPLCKGQTAAQGPACLPTLSCWCGTPHLLCSSGHALLLCSQGPGKALKFPGRSASPLVSSAVAAKAVRSKSTCLWLLFWLKPSENQFTCPSIKEEGSPLHLAHSPPTTTRPRTLASGWTLS